MAPPRLLLVGAGGHGRAVLATLRDAGWPEPAGVLDDDPACPGLPGLPWLGPVSRAAALRAEGLAAAHVALGANALRRRLGEQLLALGFDLPPVVHPSAVLAGDARLGAGSLAMPRVVLGAAARAGRHAILNSGCIVEHDCRLGEACHIAPGAVLGGGVRVGNEVLVGILAGVRPGIRIGDGALIAVGAAVVADVAAGSVMGGVPARPVRQGAPPPAPPPGR
ncbi:NeuD/PglB/VioB family sugar acetyltransferase [Roseomonas sp. E05]|uniref:NeuD/PglB/VioB family sugar acetyltransferase n=1 Tax=Roseomonas sp. E05 TaxID=3046310 RepID=UPI0024B94C1C|nr:NeuD/PglB/VioB family sugar acetyltransferase [Roseomonas sp. E05]MDJ0389300.1 NeuD/PglB/VioB family sugar acetyltransferase [Roseomonas sp. E05]